MIWAWLGAAAVGLSLGLLGSGGAILTTPILVYLVGHDEKGAIAESLAIVAAIAVFGVARAAPQGRVDFRSAMLLAVPGILGTSIGAQVAAFLTGTVQLSLLAALMLTAAALMFRGGRVNGSAAVDGIGAGGDACVTTARSVPAGGSSLWVVGMQGVGLGLATGLVGVGGGFLIVPVLVLLRKLPMPTAVGTSLAIIAVNSAVGFVQYLWLMDGRPGPAGEPFHVDWPTIALFSALGVAGSIVGSALGGRICQPTLRRIFAAFLVVMAGYIIVRQLPSLLQGSANVSRGRADAAQGHLPSLPTVYCGSASIQASSSAADRWPRSCATTVPLRSA